jgi:hypothetical protein
MKGLPHLTPSASAIAFDWQKFFMVRNLKTKTATLVCGLEGGEGANVHGLRP